MKKILTLSIAALSLMTTACDNQQVEALGSRPVKQEYKSATTRQLHFELQGNLLTGQRYQYMDQIQEEVRDVMTQQGREVCDVTVIETLDPKSLNSNGELEGQADTFPRIDVKIAGFIPQE